MRKAIYPMSYITDRLKEKSTISVILVLLTSLFANKLQPEQQAGITTSAMALLSAIGLFTKEK